MRVCGVTESKLHAASSFLQQRKPFIMRNKRPGAGSSKARFERAAPKRGIWHRFGLTVVLREETGSGMWHI